jgi:serine/threonine-protein kinase HipA
MLVLARQCGVTAAESRIVTVGARDVLLVKRFDREKTQGGYRRARMVSGLTLLRAEDTHQSRDRWSYIALAEELRRVSSTPRKDAAELFRRMCFNALITNADDHPRNHAIVAWDRDWKLSPAYDLTPMNLISLERRDLAMTCGDAGRYANADNLKSQSARFLLDPQEAERIVKEMADSVAATWYDVARGEGVSVADCETIKSAFVYEGFWHTAK